MTAKLPKRVPLRLPDYDYSQSGAYFVTICVRARKSLFGVVVNEEMQLNNYGRIVADCWQDLKDHFEPIELDAFVIMPNHVHGIIMITGEENSPALNATGIAASETREGGETPPLRPTLGQIVGYFKFQSAKKINGIRGKQGERVWQRNYYEHVIRNEKSLDRIREYIDSNPVRWDLDRENPLAKGKDDFDRWLAAFPKPEVRKYKSGRGNPTGGETPGRGNPAPTG